VFTPYKNAWLKKVDTFQLKGYAVERHAHRLAEVLVVLNQQYAHRVLYRPGPWVVRATS
jgi:hypothetical protein